MPEVRVRTRLRELALHEAAVPRPRRHSRSSMLEHITRPTRTVAAGNLPKQMTSTSGA